MSLKKWIAWNISSFCTYCYIKYIFGWVLSSYFVLFSPTFSMPLLSFFLAFSWIFALISCLPFVGKLNVILVFWMVTLIICACIPNYQNLHLLGEATGWNCPRWPGTIVTICMNYFMTKGGLVRNMELTSHHQLEEFRKGQKEMPHVLPASRILADIHLGWAMRVSPGRSLSQNDWPKKTRKLILSP